MSNTELTNPGTNNGAITKKPNIIVRAWKKGRETLIKIESKPVGKAAVRCLEGLGILGAGYGAYKIGYRNGAKSVVPTIVVTSGEVTDPEEPEEDEELEPANDEEPVIEEEQEV